jgi:hypothetical protein
MTRLRFSVNSPARAMAMPSEDENIFSRRDLSLFTGCDAIALGLNFCSVVYPIYASYFADKDDSNMLFRINLIAMGISSFASAFHYLRNDSLSLKEKFTYPILHTLCSLAPFVFNNIYSPFLSISNLIANRRLIENLTYDFFNNLRKCKQHFKEKPYRATLSLGLHFLNFAIPCYNFVKEILYSYEFYSKKEHFIKSKQGQLNEELRKLKNETEASETQCKDILQNMLCGSDYDAVRNKCLNVHLDYLKKQKLILSELIKDPQIKDDIKLIQTYSFEILKIDEKIQEIQKKLSSFFEYSGSVLSFYTNFDSLRKKVYA